ncbi:MAG: hypothetical protein L0241_13330, partial [Planctomycetia bacterium]|nr:hypothetical protein [Planctomycetia bacterium]
MAAHRYRVPTANGSVLAEPGFDALPALVEANRKLLDRTDVLIGGHPLQSIRYWLREALFTDDDIFATVIVTGHQPELSHPGVWAKNFALNALARKLGAIPLHLIVDTDTLKSPSLRFPVFREGDLESVRMESVSFDAFVGEVPYEDRGILDSSVFCDFLPKVRALTRNWGYEPLLQSAWQSIDPSYPLPLGVQFARVRQRFESEWGCENNEVTVSELSRTSGFQTFASHILSDLPRFRTAYNSAIRAYREAHGIRSVNHPAPELAEGEAPFWVHKSNGKRARATPSSDVRTLRPRALTLTLFARVCLADFFIHGVGGGKYDEVTDAIIRDYFGIEPPAYQVLSATLHLPLPTFPSTADDLKRAERHLRDLRWNPQRYLSAEQRANSEVETMLATRAALVANEPPYAEHSARRDWFRALQQVT